MSSYKVCYVGEIRGRTSESYVARKRIVLDSDRIDTGRQNWRPDMCPRMGKSTIIINRTRC